MARRDLDALPLRRIVRSVPTTNPLRPTIGTVVRSTQSIAYSLGRPMSVRRSASALSPVRVPQWLLPTLASRSDGLDPWRDRDLIALREARSRKRVTRTVEPRGLPMAAHAAGRSRIGSGTGPSAIARRLHPVRRTPTRNEAHSPAPAPSLTRVPARAPKSAPTTTTTSAANRSATRTPRARRSSTPGRPAKSDRDGPHGAPFVARSVYAGVAPTSPLDASSTFASAAVARRTALSLVSSTTPAQRDVARRRLHRSPSAQGDPSPLVSTGRTTTSSTNRVTTSASTSPDRSTSRAQPTTAARRDTPTTGHTSRTVAAMRRPLPEWTDFGTTTPPSSVPQVRTVTRESTPTNESVSRFATRDAVSRLIADQNVTTRRRVSADVLDRGTRDAPFRRPTVVAGWRGVIGLADTFDGNGSTAVVQRRAGRVRSDGGSRVGVGESQATSTLAERVARLANPTGSPLGSPGDLVRRAPVGGPLAAVAAAMAAARPMSAPTTSSRTSSTDRGTTLSRSSTSSSSRSSTAVNRSSTSPTPTRADVSRRSTQPSASRISAPASTEASVRHGRTPARDAHQASPTVNRYWTSVVTDPHHESVLQARRTLQPPKPSIGRDLVPGSIGRRHAGITPAVRAVHGEIAESRGRRVTTAVSRSATDRRVTSSVMRSRLNRPTSAPGASAAPAFAGAVARSVAFRQVPQRASAPLRQSNGSRNAAASVAVGTGRTGSVTSRSGAQSSADAASVTGPITGGGEQAAANFLARLQARTGAPSDPQVSMATTNATTSAPIAQGALSRSAGNAVARVSAPDSPSISQVIARRAMASGRGATESPASAGDNTPTLERTRPETTSSGATSTGYAPSGEHDATVVARSLPADAAGTDLAVRADVAMSSSPVGGQSVIARSVSRDPEPNPVTSAEGGRVNPSSDVMRSASLRDADTTSRSEPSATDGERVISSDSSTSDDTPQRFAASESSGRDSVSDLVARSVAARGGDGGAVRLPGVVASRTVVPGNTVSSEIMGSVSGSNASGERGGVVGDRVGGRIGRSVDSVQSRSTRSDSTRGVAGTSPTYRTVSRRMSVFTRGAGSVARNVLARSMRRPSPSPRVDPVRLDLPVAPTVIRPSQSAEVIASTDPSDAASRISRRTSSTVARRSSTTARQPATRANDGTLSADDMVRMIEAGIDPTAPRLVHRSVSASPAGVQRSPSEAELAISDRGPESFDGGEDSSPDDGDKAVPSPVDILSHISNPSTSRRAPGVSTSQLLDLIDWINRIVDDRLRIELERRGQSGGRW